MNATTYTSNILQREGPAVRATSIFAETVVARAGDGNFGEGLRAHCIITSTQGGAQCNGAVGFAASGRGQFNGIFAFEGALKNNYRDTDDQNALSQFGSAFLATAYGPHTVGGGYTINPNELEGSSFLYGFWIPSNPRNKVSVAEDALRIDAPVPWTIYSQNAGCGSGNCQIMLPNNSFVWFQDTDGIRRRAMGITRAGVLAIGDGDGLRSVEVGNTKSQTLLNGVSVTVNPAINLDGGAVLKGSAPMTHRGEIGIGAETVAPGSGRCPTSGVAGCIVARIDSVIRYIPYY